MLTKWRKIIREAKKRGKFTEQEQGMRMDVNQCAIAERAQQLGLHYSGLESSNSEHPLYVAESEFMAALMRNDFDRALNAVKQIEKLTANRKKR